RRGRGPEPGRRTVLVRAPRRPARGGMDQRAARRPRPREGGPRRGTAAVIDTDELAEARAERDALDAYSTIVTSVAELVTPSVASLQVSRRIGNGRRAQGAGSAVTLTPDGFLVTSAHVVEGTDHGVAAFADGREFDVEVIG